jgi:hypothetical protein
MSLESAHAELRARCRDLDQAVTELVTIVNEDRPRRETLVAAIDVLTETVSECQAASVRSVQLLSQVADPRVLPAVLSRIDDALAQCETTYWRDLVAYRPLAVLRRAAREHGHEWRTWQHSIELSLGRLEIALAAASAAVRSAWAEVGELLTHYISPGGGSAWPQPTTREVTTSTRRQS